MATDLNDQWHCRCGNLDYMVTIDALHGNYSYSISIKLNQLEVSFLFWIFMHSEYFGLACYRDGSLGTQLTFYNKVSEIKRAIHKVLQGILEKYLPPSLL